MAPTSAPRTPQVGEPGARGPRTSELQSFQRVLELARAERGVFRSAPQQRRPA